MRWTVQEPLVYCTAVAEAMILFLDRSQSATIYPLDRSCLGHRHKIYSIISTLIQKLFIILHIYYNLTGIDHVLDIPRVI